LVGCEDPDEIRSVLSQILVEYEGLV
jgi:hypothetical protein